MCSEGAEQLNFILHFFENVVEFKEKNILKSNKYV